MKWSEQVATPLCPWCFTELVVVEVAGHYQCASCKRVVFECCQGECADPRYNVTDAS